MTVSLLGAENVLPMALTVGELLPVARDLFNLGRSPVPYISNSGFGGGRQCGTGSTERYAGMRVEFASTDITAHDYFVFAFQWRMFYSPYRPSVVLLEDSLGNYSAWKVYDSGWGASELELQMVPYVSHPGR